MNQAGKTKPTAKQVAKTVRSRARGIRPSTLVVIMLLSGIAFLAMGIAGGSVWRGLLAAPFGAIFGWFLAVEIYHGIQLTRGTSRTLFAPKSKWIWLVSLVVAIGVAAPLAYLFDLSMVMIGVAIVVPFVATAIVCDVAFQIFRDLGSLASWCWGLIAPAKRRSESKEP
ncbi:hypothetical protein [Blastopirellula retiformator]|uniref:Uncharacterized protein n=1 Tax=Blastopirellula retiformator TaxID=2527970 RepID=A0A5C5VMR5_9BACT|nr:hypothetical protein [Blastopirellula retiformator]TWT39185.1 hypothetical protein Enr8_08810 [Blastopirellula retiformator]